MRQYIVVVGSREPYLRERNIPDLDRTTTIRELAEGQFDIPNKVIEFDLETKTCRDVTMEMAAEVAEQWACDGEPLSEWRREFVEGTLGVRAANAMERSCARGF